MSLLVVTSCAFAAACGKPEVTDSQKGNPTPGEVPAVTKNTGRDVGASSETSSRAQPKPAQSPYADISTTLVEKAGILPLGFFVFKFGDVERQCMGSYVGSGRFITAAHCFSGVAGLPFCPPNLRIQWLKSDGGSYQLSGDKTACTSVKSVLREGDDAIDVAVVKLASLGTWPAAVLTIQSSSGVISKKVKMIGPQGTGPSLYFRAYVGEPLEYSGNFFHHNAPHKAGYSGAPVFAQVDGGAPIDFTTAAVGLHVGMASGAVRAQKGEIVLEHMK